MAIRRLGFIVQVRFAIASWHLLRFRLPSHTAFRSASSRRLLPILVEAIIAAVARPVEGSPWRSLAVMALVPGVKMKWICVYPHSARLCDRYVPDVVALIRPATRACLVSAIIAIGVVLAAFTTRFKGIAVRAGCKGGVKNSSSQQPHLVHARKFG
jgi:hypothetical protein